MRVDLAIRSNGADAALAAKIPTELSTRRGVMVTGLLSRNSASFFRVQPDVKDVYFTVTAGHDRRLEVEAVT